MGTKGPKTALTQKRKRNKYHPNTMIDEIVRKIVTGTGKMAAEIEREKNLPRVYPPNDGVVYDPRWE